MKIKDIIDDVEFEDLLLTINEEKESDTYVKKAVDKVGKNVEYKQVGALKGEGLSPDLGQWKRSHDSQVTKANKIRSSLLGGMGDKDKIAAALRELRTLTSNIKSLRSKINKAIPKAAAKPGEQEASRARASAAEKKEAEKTAWKRRVGSKLKNQMSNFGAISRNK